MDHFCPWVGGVVCENNMKFFIQFAAYGLVWTSFMVALMIWICVDSKHSVVGTNPQWYAILAFAALFLIMAFGIAVQFIKFSVRNLTTIDDLKLSEGYQYFALQIPLNLSTQYRTITYPLPSQTNTSSPTKRFCVVQTKPGQNPWDLEDDLENLKMLMGHRWYEWLLPITYSPLCNEIIFGPEVDRLRRQFKLSSPTSRSGTDGSGRSRPVSRTNASDMV